MNKSYHTGSRKIRPAIIILIAGMIFSSCVNNNQNQLCIPVIPQQVSFSADVLPLFRTYCSTSGCHAGGSPGGKLNLEDSLAYIQLSKQGSGYINTAIPTHSVLYSSLISTTQPMPPSGLLDQCKVNLILKWIEQGGKDN